MPPLTHDSFSRAALLRLRLHRAPHAYVTDPYAPDYLYLVQQAKRLSLSQTMARLRPRNALLLPVLLAILLVKVIDLHITNQIVRSLINERDLIRQHQTSSSPKTAPKT